MRIDGVQEWAESMRAAEARREDAERIALRTEAGAMARELAAAVKPLGLASDAGKQKRKIAREINLLFPGRSLVFRAILTTSGIDKARAFWSNLHSGIGGNYASRKSSLKPKDVAKSKGRQAGIWIAGQLAARFGPPGMQDMEIEPFYGGLHAFHRDPATGAVNRRYRQLPLPQPGPADLKRMVARQKSHAGQCKAAWLAAAQKLGMRVRAIGAAGGPIDRAFQPGSHRDVPCQAIILEGAGGSTVRLHNQLPYATQAFVYGPAEIVRCEQEALARFREAMARRARYALQRKAPPRPEIPA